ncbi:acyl carrier protein [Nevskia soli]|uniref:acyl carrier protein n=1 Tax=Nevskia soli TaxID=418856 RepID=UPI0004A6E219|nr:acyl carrier protein [Nevskia soli]
MSSMEQQVIKMVAEQLSINESRVTPDAAFIEDLGADSLDKVELVMNLEQAFGIKVKDEDGEKVSTIQDVYDLIRSHMPPLAA